MPQYEDIQSQIEPISLNNARIYAQNMNQWKTFNGVRKNQSKSSMEKQREVAKLGIKRNFRFYDVSRKKEREKLKAGRET